MMFHTILLISSQLVKTMRLLAVVTSFHFDFTSCGDAISFVRVNKAEGRVKIINSF